MRPPVGTFGSSILMTRLASSSLNTPHGILAMVPFMWGLTPPREPSTWVFNIRELLSWEAVPCTMPLFAHFLLRTIGKSIENNDCGSKKVSNAPDRNIIVKKTGDTSWSADNMRKYLTKIERNEYLPAGNPDHGYDGMLFLTFLPSPLMTNKKKKTCRLASNHRRRRLLGQELLSSRSQDPPEARLSYRPRSFQRRPAGQQRPSRKCAQRGRKGLFLQHGHPLRLQRQA